MPKNNAGGGSSAVFSVRTLVCCALLAAISVVLARLLIPMPNATTRFSIEAIPIFLAGMLFGPVPGALVGFVADMVGCLFSGYGYNPIFCIPPILYGLAGGFFQAMLVKKFTVGRLAIAWAVPVIFGSILYQSWALTFIYSAKDAFLANFLVRLGGRSIQFAVTFVLDVLITWLLYRAKVFSATHLWPPAASKKRAAPQKDAEPRDPA